MPKFKAGDHAVIRKDLSISGKYVMQGKDLKHYEEVTKRMVNMAGKSATIRDVVSWGGYLIEEDGGFAIWVDGMFA